MAESLKINKNKSPMISDISIASKGALGMRMNHRGHWQISHMDKHRDTSYTTG